MDSIQLMVNFCSLVPLTLRDFNSELFYATRKTKNKLLKPKNRLLKPYGEAQVQTASGQPHPKHVSWSQIAGEVQTR